MVAVVAMSALALGACGDDDDSGDGGTDTETETTETQADEDAGEPLVVELAAQGANGVAGTATFTADGDRTTVLIELEGDESTDPHPAHVHEGTCEQFDAAPTYPLENVVDGRSETTLDAPIDEVTTGTRIVNVHRSEAAIDEYVSCGAITADGGGEAAEDEVVVDLAEQSDSGLEGTATLTPIDGDQTRVVIELDDDETTPRPAHIHDGTCEQFEAAPAYPLENVVEGRSDSTLAAPLAEVATGERIVNVHESEAAIDSYVACGPVG
jgi:hypothetical protein